MILTGARATAGVLLIGTAAPRDEQTVRRVGSMQAMMTSARMWAIATVVWAAVAGLGIAGLVLELPDHSLWLTCWLGGLLVAIACARRRKKER
jgi:hypothetical protein